MYITGRVNITYGRGAQPLAREPHLETVLLCQAFNPPAATLVARLFFLSPKWLASRKKRAIESLIDNLKVSIRFNLVLNLAYLIYIYI